MTYSVSRWDKICTHLYSSCIISSYFWMTLAPSADSRHLQRRWNFTAHAKVISYIFPVANIPKHHFYEAFKTERLIHTEKMHEQARIHFCNVPCWRRERRLTGGRGVWIWRRGSGCAAASPGPISARQLLLAYSYSLESNLRRSRIITYCYTDD